MRETRSTCPYCGVGCGVIIESDGAQITGVRGDPDHPANFGRLCTKGSTLHLTASPAVQQTCRLLQPQWRAERGGAMQPLGWDAALELAADRLAATIDSHGPDSVGFYLSGQMLTEDYYVYNKLMKGLIGSNNVDTNSRLCMSSAVAGYKRTLGADAPPCSYEDLALADTVFIAGSNAAWAHPILFRRLEDARRAKPDQRWIVVDTRRTETAEGADLFLQICPGTDVALFHGMLSVIFAEQLADLAWLAQHTSGIESLHEILRGWNAERAAEICGIRLADLVQAARWFAQADRAGGATLSLYCQGLNQSSAGTDKNAALIHLHLATAQIGRPGAGPFSLTGQPNAMGGREVGGLANLLSAHRDLANPMHRAEVAALWGLPSVPEQPGLSAVEMFQAAAAGQLQALWIVCTNPAQSLPDQATVQRALQRCPFVVLQDAYATTATAPFADLLLPATTWGEKVGTVTNSERRISRVRAAIPAPGEARHDWAIGVEFAHRLEQRLPQNLHGQTTLFPYDLGDAERGAEQIWQEHRESTRGRDLDITGLSWDMLDRDGPQQWPLPEGADSGRVRLYADGHFPTPDGRARFVAIDYRPVAEPTSVEYPIALNTGRLRDQWHGMSRTGTLGRLFGHVPEPVVELHPQTLSEAGVSEGDLVRLRSPRGGLVLPARASTDLAPGQAWIPMHWGGDVLGGQDLDGRPMPGVNGLTQPASCPHSKQPELKHAAVSLQPAGLGWQMVALVWLPQAQALAAREALKPLLAQCAFAVCLPFGREPHAGGLSGVLLRAAEAEPATAEQAQALRGWLDRVQTLLGLGSRQALSYEDARRARRRMVQYQAENDTSPLQDRSGGRPLSGLLLAGDTQSESWLRTLLLDELPAEALGRGLLAPVRQASAHLAPRSPQVCSCFNVSEQAIREQLGHCSGNADQRLAGLQGALKCGTQCGSCLPTLRRLVAESLQAA
ncbi:MAG: molybdopterin-dependent oxidoreductase [Burkholderiales bacterium]|jgi:assimilatory nitrate reductase catalytic subunit|nr:molybdopterin-dependent oxidoreductase [Burkholderiales bacterium]